jgi:hypothetical protein
MQRATHRRIGVTMMAKISEKSAKVAKTAASKPVAARAAKPTETAPKS